MFKKAKPSFSKPFSPDVSARVAKIPTNELEMWIDQATYELGKCMSMYSKNREKYYLDEALKGAEALHAVVHELHSRSNL